MLLNVVNVQQLGRRQDFAMFLSTLWKSGAWSASGDHNIRRKKIILHENSRLLAEKMIDSKKN